MEIFQYYWIGAPIVILLFFYNAIRIWCVCLCVCVRVCVGVSMLLWKSLLMCGREDQKAGGGWVQVCGHYQGICQG